MRRVSEPPRRIVLTDADKTRLVEVLAVGPGKWIPGEWWSVLQPDGTRKWEWFEGKRECMQVRPGDIVTLPGVASTDPDHIMEDGSFFVTEQDFGYILNR